MLSLQIVLCIYTCCKKTCVVSRPTSSSSPAHVALLLFQLLNLLLPGVFEQCLVIRDHSADSTRCFQMFKDIKYAKILDDVGLNSSLEHHWLKIKH